MQIWSTRSVLGRCTVTKFVLCTAFILVIYNEYLCFTLSSWTWAPIPQRRDNSGEMKILIVADPQIVGLLDEHWLFGIITRWDCDKYLRSGFQQALSHVNPSVVIFLGDLLDEGSKASDAHYLSYVERFHNIFKMPPHIYTVFVPGDNDVGGEWSDIKEARKVNQFYEQFAGAAVKQDNIINVNAVDFIPMSFDLGESIAPTSTLYAHLSDLAKTKSATAEYTVVCNHMSIINRQMKEYKEVLNLLEPSIMLTAHTHSGAIFKCTNCKSMLTEGPINKRPSGYVHELPGGPRIDLPGVRWPAMSQWSGDVIPVVDSSIHTMNLKDSSVLYEVVIPTCSYRMGVPRMGYGSAVLDSDGVFRYTVLWLPSRYLQFNFYIIFGGVTVLLLILTCFCRIVFGRRNIQPRNIPI